MRYVMDMCKMPVPLPHSPLYSAVLLGFPISSCLAALRLCSSRSSCFPCSWLLTVLLCAGYYIGGCCMSAAVALLLCVYVYSCGGSVEHFIRIFCALSPNPS